MKYKKFPQRKFLHIIISPLIYFCSIGLITFDIFLELYHRTTFPIYKYNYIDRKKYIKIDRHKLQYLSFIEKVNCAYCGYANGLIQYTQVILAFTEEYWCGIKHENSIQDHQKDFIEYGDKITYNKTSLK